MRVIETRKNLESTLDSARSAGKKIAFVPTLGALHDGHLALVKKGREMGDFMVVSIFVNPKQFGANEDFGKYPRTFDEDVKKLESIGVDLLYFPSAAEVYGVGGPESFTLSLDVPHLTRCLCGVSRPHFFGGVLAVVMKLFLQIRPDFAIFGKKDYQQFLVVKELARSLDIGVSVFGMETFREASGLAMSSRNQYLSEEERLQASAIFRVLQDVRRQYNGGDMPKILLDAKNILEGEGMKIDYLEVRSGIDLRLIGNFEGYESLPVVFIAAFFKGVRLIDNLELYADF